MKPFHYQHTLEPTSCFERTLPDYDALPLDPNTGSSPPAGYFKTDVFGNLKSGEYELHLRICFEPQAMVSSLEANDGDRTVEAFSISISR